MIVSLRNQIKGKEILHTGMLGFTSSNYVEGGLFSLKVIVII